MRKLNDCQAIKEAILRRWPKFDIKIFDEKNEQTFILDFGDDYTKLFLCFGDFKQEDGNIFVFISTGNDEIKDTTVYKKYFDFDNGTDEENVFRVLELSLREYAHDEYVSWKPSNDDLKRYEIPDPCEGHHSYQKVERITGIPYK